MDLQKEIEMSYDEYVEYLLKKYGKAEHNYFRTESCKSPNPKAKRTKEGLQCHHIDEDKYDLLCNSKLAPSCPWECQKADRLVYANMVEHLLLHIKINLIRHTRDCGVSLIIESIDAMLDDPDGISGWRVHMFNAIKDDLDNYIKLKEYAQDIGVWSGYEKGRYERDY